VCVNVFSEGMVMQLCMYILFGDGCDRLKMLKQKEQTSWQTTEG